MVVQSTIKNYQFARIGCLISAFASVYFLVLPIVLSAASGDNNWTETQVGSLASLYLLGFTLSGMLAAYFWRVFSERLVRLFSALMMAIGFVVSGIFPETIVIVSTGHFLAGVGAGTLYTASFNLVAASEVPESAFGWKLASEQALGAMSFLVLTYLEIGFQGMMIFLSVLGVVSAFVFYKSPISQLPAFEQADKANKFPGRSLLVGLFSVGVFMAVLSGIWAFLEPITQSAGLSSQLFGTIGAAGLVLGGVGGLTAGFLGARFGTSLPLGFCSLLLLAILVGLASKSFWAASIAAFAFSFMWNLALAYQLSAIANLDRAGSFSGWLSPVIAAGATLGPISAALLIYETNIAVLIWVSAILATASLLLSAVISK